MGKTKPSKVQCADKFKGEVKFSQAKLAINETVVSLLGFSDKRQMNLALYRPQLYYEDVQVLGEKLSWDDLRLLPGGIRQFDGFNIPLRDYVSWLTQFSFDELNDAERGFKKELERALKLDFNKKFCSKLPAVYILAFVASDRHGHDHELYHAIYLKDEAYKKLVQERWSQLSDSTQRGLKGWLLAKRYHEKHHLDEFQAYVAESPHVFGKKYSSELFETFQVLQTYVCSALRGCKTLEV